MKTIFCHFSEPYLTAQTTCSRNLLVQNVNNQSGLIQSSTGTHYSPHMNCSWTIKSNVKLELVFVGRFKMESAYDFVYVHDGNSSSAHLIGQFSGSARPGPIVISSNQLYVRFTSDLNVQYYGFKAVYRGMCFGQLRPSCSSLLTDILQYCYRGVLTF